MKKFTLLPFLWILTACPSYQIVRPRIEGSVLDASTKIPIHKAEIHVRPESKAYYSDSSGNFKIQSRRDWVWYPMIFPVDHFYSPIEIKAIRTGYSGSEKSVSGNNPSKNVIFYLKPLQK